MLSPPVAEITFYPFKFIPGSVGRKSVAALKIYYTGLNVAAVGFPQLVKIIVKVLRTRMYNHENIF